MAIHSWGTRVQLLVGVIFGALLPYFVHILYGKAFSQTVMFAWLLLPAGAFKDCCKLPIRTFELV